MIGAGAALAGGLLAGVLHALALGSAAGWLLAWVALVPLLWVVERAALRAAVGAVLVYALAVLAIDVAPWLLPTLERYFQLGPVVARATGVVAVALTGLAYGALLALPLALRRRAGRPLGVLWCAALWSVWEALRTAAIPPYFPLSVLGTSQVEALPVLQLASVTGIAGVTALVVLVNAAVAGLRTPAGARPRSLLAGAGVALLVLATGLWGSLRVARAPAPAAGGPTVILVDGAAADATESTLERYVAATATDPTRRPALVIWPESALAFDLARDGDAWARLSAFVADLGAPLATGGVGSMVGDDGAVAHFNSVHFVRPGHGMATYHKRLLVPFAESWPALLGPPPPAIEPIAAGRELAVFGEDGAAFGPLICFEITDAASVRALARRHARLVVNVNNDVWFGDRGAPQRVWARVRAVESGLPVVRATNGGTSAVIDPVGRVLASARAAGRPVVLAGAIPEPVDTLYVWTGEVFLPACLLVVVGGLWPARRLTGSPRTGSSGRRA